jgi:hypothetical protein
MEMAGITKKTHKLRDRHFARPRNSVRVVPN